MTNEIKIGSIVTMYDRKNYWPVKITKKTKTRATVIRCTLEGEEFGEPISGKVYDIGHGPQFLYKNVLGVYLTKEYNKENYMSYSDI